MFPSISKVERTPNGRIPILDSFSRPNLLINPNWQIDQINEGALYTFNGAAANGPDGWSGEAIGGGGGVFKLRTLADPDNAALKCLEITCTTADVAIAAGERYTIFSAIEGFDVAALQAGIVSAQPVTVQFKFKSNVPGPYGVSIANSAKNRSYVGVISVPDTAEHEYALVIPMDIAGVWLYTNGVGLYLRLTLAGGTTFQATPGSWQAADNYVSAAGQTNFMSANTNIAYLKRVQLIPGALVQAYKPADLQKELAKAQRYYEKSFAQGTAPVTALGVNTGEFKFAITKAAALANIPAGFTPFQVSKRAAASTITIFNPVNANSQVYNDAFGGDHSATASGNVGMAGFRVLSTGNAGGAIGDEGGFHWTANTRLS